MAEIMSTWADNEGEARKADVAGSGKNRLEHEQHLNYCIELTILSLYH